MKNKLFLLTFLLLQVFALNAQNLVPNGDFETNTGFPSATAQYALATGWDNCNGGGSPDYAHVNGTGLVGLPNNYFGIHSPHGGDAVMGLILWHSTAPSFREYIDHAFSTPLVVGNTYNVSFFLTNGGSSGNYGGNGVDQVSIAFSTSPLVQTGNTQINFTPQFVFPSVFFDSTWQQVSFQFIADSAYTHFTFGNFKSDANTVSQFFRTEGIQAAYYFIDDIVVENAIGAAPVVALASSDTTFCGKQCIDFTDLSTNSPTSWQWLFPGADSTFSIMQNPTGICYNSYGSFDVTLIACNPAGCDTLILPGFIQAFPNPPIPVTTWIGDTLFSTPSFAYQWYFNSVAVPGANSQYYVSQQPGSYFVVVTDSNGCASPSIVLSTGIDQHMNMNNSNIYVVPEIASDGFVLYGAPAHSYVKIYNLNGQVIYNNKTGSGAEQIHLNATDGIYFLELFSGNRIFRKKIIFQN